jgi:hypothetical protein
MSETEDNDNDNIQCTGCGTTLQQWDPDLQEEGDAMWIVPRAGGEDILCENCYARRLQKK